MKHHRITESFYLENQLSKFQRELQNISEFPFGYKAFVRKL